LTIHFINRELSCWNLTSACSTKRWIRHTAPGARQIFLYHQLNLDEFFEDRVAGLKQQIESGVVERSIDGLTPARRLRHHQAHPGDTEQQYACWREQLVRVGRTRHRF